MEIRTRFAPSPTGYIHVGNVRSAFFAWLFARSQNGKFIIRIEDTDQERSSSDFTECLLNDMEWLGLDWDEGPRKEGEFGPYFQSKRLNIYAKYTEMLLNSGHAFRCYCTEDDLKEERELAKKEFRPPHYSGKCRSLTDAEKKVFNDKNQAFVVRFKSYDVDFVLNDLIKGEILFPKGMVGDFVILRQNGVPVYNFAVVVDDISMKISHVFRADEHLSNTVRQLMIYKALAAPLPLFGHMALVLGEDGKKLSKRHGATSIREFRDLGYLPKSLCNALALLGWSSPNAQEILSINEMINLFTIDRVSSSPSIFDFKRLNWISKHDIMNTNIEKITELALPYLNNAGFSRDNDIYTRNVLEIVRGNCENLSEIVNYVDYFFGENYTIEKDAQSLLSEKDTQTILSSFKQAIEEEKRDIDKEVYKDLINFVKTKTGLTGKPVFSSIRVGITGKLNGPELFLILPTLGKEKVLKRLLRQGF